MAGAAAATSATRTLALLACWCGDDREVVDEKERCQDRALEHIGKQPVHLLVSAKAVFFSQQISISRTYQPRNQPAG